MQLLQSCPETEGFMTDVMDHFNTSMVPSILVLQKASTSAAVPAVNQTQTVVDFVNSLIVLANGISDKKKVCIYNAMFTVHAFIYLMYIGG